MLANAGQVDEPIDRPEQMIHWDVPVQVEAVEQRFLQHRSLAHHRRILQSTTRIESGESEPPQRVFQHHPPISDVQAFWPGSRKRTWLQPPTTTGLGHSHELR